MSAGPVSSNRGRKCEWEVQQGYEFAIGDFSSKADTLEEVPTLPFLLK